MILNVRRLMALCFFDVMGCEESIQEVDVILLSRAELVRNLLGFDVLFLSLLFPSTGLGTQ